MGAWLLLGEAYLVRLLYSACRKYLQLKSGISGYSTGAIIKEHAQRQEFIEDFYAKHPNTSRASVRAEICRRQSQRAVSLPNVLEEGPRYIPARYQDQRTSPSENEHTQYSDDLLYF